jgi:hypothetical protein
MNQKKFVPGAPKRIGSLISQLLSRRGYAQIMAGEELQAILAAEVGEQLAGSVRVGNVKRGVLHIYLADSVTHQELTFRKRSILRRIESDLPAAAIRDIRFHVSAAAQQN